MAIKTIKHPRLGEIKIKTYAQSRAVKFKIDPSGVLLATTPLGVSEKMILKIIDHNEQKITKLLNQHPQSFEIKDGEEIGKSHTLIIRQSKNLSVESKDLKIILNLPAEIDPKSKKVYTAIKPQVIKALRKEAKAYLPKRISKLADDFGFRFDSLRFNHASTRWGSCKLFNINLNIALMKLPFELIDYVLIHELSHTKHPNHSSDFWAEVQRCIPNYKMCDKNLKKYSPHI